MSENGFSTRDDGADGFPYFCRFATNSNKTAQHNSYLARRKRKRIGGAVVKRRDGDGNGGFMDSRLLDRDKIQIALLFCSALLWPFAAPLTGLETDPLTPSAARAGVVISAEGEVAALQRCEIR